MNMLTRVGIALMVIAFAILGYFIVIPAVMPSVQDTPWLHGPYQALFCHSGETLGSDSETYHPRPGETDTTLTLSCVDAQGNARDVSGSVIAVGMIGYLAPFLIGLFMWTTGNNQKKQTATPTYADVYNGKLGKESITVNRGGRQITVDKNGDYGVGVSDSSATDADSPSALKRLKTLKTAYEQGLITQDEYESKREELLKRM